MLLFTVRTKLLKFLSKKQLYLGDWRVNDSLVAVLLPKTFAHLETIGSNNTKTKINDKC